MKPKHGKRRTSAVLAQLEAPDLAAVHLVRPVGEAERARVRPHGRERELLAHAAAPVELHGALDHPERRVGHGDFDLGDRLAGRLVADRVHHVRGVEHEQARLIDLDPRLGDALERDVVLARGLPKATRFIARLHMSSSARSATPIWRMQWWMRPGPRRPWAISKPRPSPSSMFDAGTRTFSNRTSPWPCGASS